MHPCPCCGYKTLPGRGDYDLCPVCHWEDEGLEPWEFSGPNGQSLLAAQVEFLGDERPFRRRDGVRAPRTKEARDPGWQPIEATDELLARAAVARRDAAQEWEETERRHEQERAENPEGRFKGYNAAVAALRDDVPHLAHRDVTSRLRQNSQGHDVAWSAGHLELWARMLANEDHYRARLHRAVWWTVRFGRPGTYRRSWREVRTGHVSFASLPPPCATLSAVTT